MIKDRTKISENDFINKADEKINTNTKPKKEVRKYKSITLPMNKDEYERLVKLASEYEQSLTGIIRFALKRLDGNNCVNYSGV